ncbi:MAG: glycosyltransferase family 2 protein [Proteobacteria bacterium]|nr:glycosyltransferase family 2 protein [Pseudomonadota bacterium]
MNHAAKPDIAILMLTFNHAWSLPETLDSLLAQTYQDFHLLIVDDLSQDSSFEIAQSYKEKFKSCTVLRNEKNKGAIGNFHDSLQQLEKAMPDAWFFLWACPDDTWSPTFLEKTRNVLLNDGEAVVCQSWFDMANIHNGSVSPRHLAPLEARSYREARKIFYPCKSQAGAAYYNNMLHGLIRFSEMRNIFPARRKFLAAAFCIEISMMAAMLLRGRMTVIPEPLFHKKTSGSFVDIHKNDELTLRWFSLPRRVEGTALCLPWLWRICKPNRPRVMTLFIWFHLFYFYVVLYVLSKANAIVKRLRRC